MYSMSKNNKLLLLLLLGVLRIKLDGWRLLTIFSFFWNKFSPGDRGVSSRLELATHSSPQVEMATPDRPTNHLPSEPQTNTPGYSLLQSLKASI